MADITAIHPPPSPSGLSSSPTTTVKDMSAETGLPKTPTLDHKANVAADESLRESSTSTETLLALCFDATAATTTVAFNIPEPTPSLLKINVPPPPTGHPEPPVPVSSASSTCTRESDAHFSDAECGTIAALGGSGSPRITTTTTGSTTLSSPTAYYRLYRQVSEQLNAKVCRRTVSRQGRAGQRTAKAANERLVRLVTGAVPILKDGKILFISSRKKAEWILPKGGWEKDEAMEESAIREVFEEAGVLGVLGPRLSEVQYETRKAKKRRLLEANPTTATTAPTVETETDQTGGLRPPSKCEEEPPSQPSSPDTPAATEPTTTLLSAQDMERIRGAEQNKQQQQQGPPTDSSVASVAATSPHSEVRMTMFPLYVQKVYSEWPESGRFRKAVDIDTALEMLENRPELQAVVREVKERELHLMMMDGKPR